ncbi:MAG: CheB methylesterase domain-containing protein [Sulfurimonas sp.]|uniref:CheB methylesterase domain-containing protein n=1 Tax=Sulfurimonas sp. TaxID=2022749 RepID=UPI0025E92FC9|nr:CheB methylesterase domain-containing protein [Sulfurimonas sp.]MCK9491109.1 CheB methylesterase domain-containing protein [Sulfurimonas sp.]
MSYEIPKKIVLIAASTGGPGQIEKIIKALPKLNDTSIVIAQHMVVGFMDSFAKRLDEDPTNSIFAANDKTYLVSSGIYVCSGYTRVSRDSNGIIFSKKDSKINTFNPDINYIFSSFLPFTKDIKFLSVILTGIGADGVEACKALQENGSLCLTETQQSAIVDGMPSRARKEIQNIKVLDIKEIVEEIREFCS